MTRDGNTYLEVDQCFRLGSESLEELYNEEVDTFCEAVTTKLNRVNLNQLNCFARLVQLWQYGGGAGGSAGNKLEVKVNFRSGCFDHYPRYPRSGAIIWVSLSPHFSSKQSLN